MKMYPQLPTTVLVL